jgi:hypothetical protein
MRAAAAFITGRTAAAHNPDDLQTWTDLCHVLFNVKEFIFVR